ncbi:MAG: hypothetical protein JWO66_1251, partial [Candidatus Eremiobacteraeota bacterium]|nr:hypothetical protein [Candidatus Eremiobacteraeota bacterium]
EIAFIGLPWPKKIAGSGVAISDLPALRAVYGLIATAKISGDAWLSKRLKFSANSPAR